MTKDELRAWIYTVKWVDSECEYDECGNKNHSSIYEDAEGKLWRVDYCNDHPCRRWKDGRPLEGVYGPYPVVAEEYTAVTYHDDEEREDEFLDPPKIKLWLDDLRDPVDHGHLGWLWVKQAREAIRVLQTGCVVKASLDHDLTIKQTMGEEDGKDTGYTVVCWMEEHDVWPPEGVAVHSMNPSGRQRMELAIARAYERKKHESEGRDQAPPGTSSK